MVELNCETDFVARNSKFHTLLNEVITTKFNILKSSQSGNASDTVGLQVSKQNLAPIFSSNCMSVLINFYLFQHWNQEQLSALPTENGKTFADLLALNIGQVSDYCQP